MTKRRSAPTKNEKLLTGAFRKKALAKLFLSFTLLLTSYPAGVQAQFDDLEDTFNPPGDFPPPPPPPPSGGSVPPPPPPSMGSSRSFPTSSSSALGSASGAAGSGEAGDGILTKNQKEKFARAGVEDITNENFPETIESFDFPNAEVQDIVKAISELTGRNFIIDPDVRGKITILAPSKITVAEAYKAFLSALAIRGFTVIPSGGFWKIRNSRSAQKDGIDLYSGAYYPNSDQLITRVIQFKHISAEQMEKNLRNLISRDGDFFVYPSTNSIILTDYGSNIERVVKIFSQMDVPGFEDQMEVIRIRYAKAKDLAELLNKILNKGETPQGRGGAPGSFSSGVPRFNRPTNSSSQSQPYFVVIPDERSNSLIVVGNKAGIDKIKKLVAQLDSHIRPEESGGVFVYYVKHGEAEKIAQTLTGVAKEAAPQQRPGAGGGGGFGAIPFVSPTTGKTQSNEIFGGDVKITADKATNSLVIVASKQDYEVVLALLDKIDIPRDQVFVEAVIVEMNAQVNNDWQVGYFKFTEAGRVGGFGDGKKAFDLLSPLGTAAGILGFASDQNIEIKSIGGTAGQTIKIPNFLAFLSFLQTNAKANVLSSPQIIALDNQEAEIDVGDRVATSSTKTPATATSPSTETPNFEDATINLKITPNISPQQNTVRMAIQAKVAQPSSAKSAKTLQDQTLSLAKRMVKTNIVVPNGDTAVIGGLMKENETVLQKKVPLLGDIPVLGWLFKSSEVSKEKVNMLIFITPKIIRSDFDRKELLGKKVDQRIKYIKSAGGVDPFGETIDEVTGRKAAAPAVPSTENPIPR